MRRPSSKSKRRKTRRTSDQTEPTIRTPRRSASADAHTDPMVRAEAPRRTFEDDRPTEIFEPKKATEVHQSREQLIAGGTIREIMQNSEHRLRGALDTLLSRARSDLPTVDVDPRASLLLRHDFEFNRRVGYHLRLRLFDRDGRTVEVSADLDHDGRAIRRGSLLSKLIDI